MAVNGTELTEELASLLNTIWVRSTWPLRRRRRRRRRRRPPRAHCRRPAVAGAHPFPLLCLPTQTPEEFTVYYDEAYCLANNVTYSHRVDAESERLGRAPPAPGPAAAAAAEGPLPPGRARRRGPTCPRPRLPSALPHRCLQFLLGAGVGRRRLPVCLAGAAGRVCVHGQAAVCVGAHHRCVVCCPAGCWVAGHCMHAPCRVLGGGLCDGKPRRRGHPRAAAAHPSQHTPPPCVAQAAAWAS